MKGPARPPFTPRLPGLLTSGMQRSDPEFWKDRAEAEAAAETEKQAEAG